MRLLSGIVALLAGALAIGVAPAQSPISNMHGGGPSNCPQASSYLAAVSIDPAHAAAAATLICSAVTNAYYPFIGGLYLFATADATSALVNAANPGTCNGTAHGAPAFSANHGYTGVDGSSTVYIDTGCTLANFGATVGNVGGGLFVWSNTNVTPATGGVAIGATTGAGCTNGAMLAERLPTGKAAAAAFTTTRFTTVSSPPSATGAFLAGNTTTFVSLIQDAGYLGVGGPLTASADPAATVAILACNSGGTITLGDPNEIAVAMVFNYGGIANTTTATLICHDVNVYLTALNGAASIC